jgi:hypothetical protein
VSDFFGAISSFLDEDAWRVLVDLGPSGPGRAARDARVVAEALRSRADQSHLEKLSESIQNEELLALFELSRGELTETEMPTAGKRAQSGEPE